VLIEASLKYDPFSRNLFCFTNKRKNQIKVLYWERSGFCLWLKEPVSYCTSCIFSG
jgi:transposase